jgi:hypothetical protein
MVSEDTKAEMFWGWLRDEPGTVEKEVERAALTI